MADEPQRGIQVIDRRWWARGETAAGERGRRTVREADATSRNSRRRVAAKDEELSGHADALPRGDCASSSSRGRGCAATWPRRSSAARRRCSPTCSTWRTISIAPSRPPGRPGRMPPCSRAWRWCAPQFLAKLDGHGVRPVDAAGQPFDPSLHEAATTVPVSDPAQDGVVVGDHPAGLCDTRRSAAAGGRRRRGVRRTRECQHETPDCGGRRLCRHRRPRGRARLGPDRRGQQGGARGEDELRDHEGRAGGRSLYADERQWRRRQGHHLRCPAHRTARARPDRRDGRRGPRLQDARRATRATIRTSARPSAASPTASRRASSS